MTNVSTRLAGFFARYEPHVAALGKELRAKLRARLPGLSEIVYVYENQESLVIAYSPSEHGYEGICSLAVDPTGVKLHFGRGARLSKADPSGLLRGRGKTVRHVVLERVADFDRAEIQALIAAALELAQVRLDPNAQGASIVQADSQEQRARRAAKKARATPAVRKKATRATGANRKKKSAR